MSHTPGPFRKLDIGDRVVIVKHWDGENREVAVAHVPTRLPWHENAEKSREEAYANAYLIAAAPDLLAACEAVFNHAPSLPDGLAVQVVSAIKKARGER